MLNADKNCKKAKHRKKDPRKIAKKGSMGGLSIMHPVPITKCIKKLPLYAIFHLQKK